MSDITKTYSSAKDQYEAGKAAMERMNEIYNLHEKVKNGTATDEDVDDLLLNSAGDIIGAVDKSGAASVLWDLVTSVERFSRQPTGKSPEEYAREQRILKFLMEIPRSQKPTGH